MSDWKSKAASAALAAEVAANLVTGGSSSDQLAHSNQSQNEQRMEQTSETAAAQAPAVTVQEPPN